MAGVGTCASRNYWFQEVCNVLLSSFTLSLLAEIISCVDFSENIHRYYIIHSFSTLFHRKQFKITVGFDLTSVGLNPLTQNHDSQHFTPFQSASSSSQSHFYERCWIIWTWTAELKSNSWIRLFQLIIHSLLFEHIIQSGFWIIPCVSFWERGMWTHRRRFGRRLPYLSTSGRLAYLYCLFRFSHFLLTTFLIWSVLPVLKSCCRGRSLVFVCCSCLSIWKLWLLQNLASVTATATSLASVVFSSSQHKHVTLFIHLWVHFILSRKQDRSCSVWCYKCKYSSHFWEEKFTISTIFKICLRGVSAVQVTVNELLL